MPRVEYSTDELVQLPRDGDHVLDSPGGHPLIADSCDDESKVVKLSDAQKHAPCQMYSIPRQNSQIFNTLKLLGMEKSHGKPIRSLFVSSESAFHDLNDTLCCDVVVIHNFQLEITFKNIEISY